MIVEARRKSKKGQILSMTKLPPGIVQRLLFLLLTFLSFFPLTPPPFASFSSAAFNSDDDSMKGDYKRNCSHSYPHMDVINLRKMANKHVLYVKAIRKRSLSTNHLLRQT
jgi:hypothetical protein